MKKLLKLGAALVILALVFTACPPPPVTDVPVVTGISLRVATTATGAVSSAKPASLKPEDERWFSAVVTGAGEFEAGYNLVITRVDAGDLAELLTVEDVSGSSAKKVTIKEDAEGKINVTATSIGLNASGIAVIASWDIDVKVNGIIDGPIFDNPVWKINNTATGRGKTLNSLTTTTVSASGGRYTIFNNEPEAWIDANANVINSTSHPTPAENNAFRDVTIMYMDIPFASDPDDWKQFGIEARIRIADYRDSAPLSAIAGIPGVAWAQARQGVAMVAIENPANINPAFDTSGLSIANDAPWFVGPRMTASGQIRSYLRRAQNGTYGSVQFAQTEDGSPKFSSEAFGMTPVELRTQMGDRNQFLDGGTNENLDKNYAFSDQEFIYRLTRTGQTTYKVSVWTGDGLIELVDDANAFSSTASPGAVLTGDDDVYFAFLIYGVKAEISDIKLFYGDEEWVDPAVANATPITETPRRVRFTHSDTDYAAKALQGAQYENYNYAVLDTNFPTALVLTPQVIPINLDQEVSLDIDGNTILGLLEDSLVRGTRTAYGPVTVTATPTAGAVKIAGSNLFKLFIEEAASEVTSVTIAPPQRTELTAGQSVTLSASAVPVTAPQTVTWTVAIKEGGGSAAAVATITTAGVLTAAATAPATDTVVTVTATSTVTTTVFGTIDITIKAPASGDNIFFEWKTGDGFITDGKLKGISARQSGGTTSIIAEGANAGNIQIGNSRFILGSATTTPALTTGSYYSNAELDLSKKFKITLTYTESSNAGSFWIYVYNDAGGSGGGPITSTNGDGSANAIMLRVDTNDANPASGQFRMSATGATVELIVDPADLTLRTEAVTAGLTKDQVLKNALLQFRADSNAPNFVISHIKLEYVETAPPTAYYEWNAGTALATFTDGSNQTVNGKIWTVRSGSSNITVDADGIKLGPNGMRLVIGTASTTDSTADTINAVDAQLDFSTKKKLSITYVNGTALTGNFQVQLNNSSTGGAGSPLGTASRIRTGALPNAAGTLELTIDPATFGNHASLANAYLMIRTDGTPSHTVTITRILIEDID